MLLTNGGICLFDIVHTDLWGSEYTVCTPDAQVLLLSGARMLSGGIRNIPQYRLSTGEYRQPKLPSSYQLHHLVLRLLTQVVNSPPCSGFEPGTSRTKVRRSNHYTIELGRLRFLI
jgi:hypothetical protein